MTAEETLREIYASLPTVDCKRLCGPGYCGPIIAYPTERRHMEQAGWPQPFAYTVGMSCGYFDAATSACRVHAARPLICRLFGAVRDARMVCPHGCQPSRWLTDAEVWALLQRIEAVDGPPSLADGHVIQLKGV